jgi:AcrR family transcriptional regulator
VESITVDDVVKEAGVAKGTFYVHFDSLEALTTAVAEELVKSFDEMLQSSRGLLADPALRVAFGCSSFITKALDDPKWASLAARMALAGVPGGEITRRRLFEDIQRLSKGLPVGGGRAELILEIVVGIMLQLMRAIGEGRLSSADSDAALVAILRAIGLDARQVKTLVARVASLGDATSLASDAKKYPRFAQAKTKVV